MVSAVCFSFAKILTHQCQHICSRFYMLSHSFTPNAGSFTAASCECVYVANEITLTSSVS